MNTDDFLLLKQLGVIATDLRITLNSKIPDRNTEPQTSLPSNPVPASNLTATIVSDTSTFQSHFPSRENTPVDRTHSPSRTDSAIPVPTPSPFEALRPVSSGPSASEVTAPKHRRHRRRTAASGSKPYLTCSQNDMIDSLQRCGWAQVYNLRFSLETHPRRVNGHTQIVCEDCQVHLKVKSVHTHLMTNAHRQSRLNNG